VPVVAVHTHKVGRLDEENPRTATLRPHGTSNDALLNVDVETLDKQPVAVLETTLLTAGSNDVSLIVTAVISSSLKPALSHDFRIPTLLDRTSPSLITVFLQGHICKTTQIALPNINIEDLEPFAPSCFREYGATNEMFVAMRNGWSHLWSRWAPAGKNVAYEDAGDAGAFVNSSSLSTAAGSEAGVDDADFFLPAPSIYDDTLFEDCDSSTESSSGSDEADFTSDEEDSDDEHGICVVFG
jgi:hypothetical protein